ncbi:hypothetical protein BDV18DRAFT_154203 [Aspergillus unguis]
MPFQNVALLGKGVLGSVLLTELIKSDYKVTVLSRSASTTEALPGVTVKEVDYTSPTSLEDALRGNEIIISTLSATAIALQKPIIDAAIAVGAKRFIPAEYGAMTTDPRGKDLPFHTPALEIREYLQEREQRGEIEYTVLGVGLFAHFLFGMPLAVDFAGRSARLYDGGAHPISVSRVETVAKAVVASLERWEETKNRIVRVHDAVLTQRQVLGFAKKWFPGEWTETDVDASKEVQDLLAQIDQRFDPSLLYILFAAALFSGKYGAAYTEVDNELLGIEGLSEQEIEEYGYGIASAAT